MTLSIRYVGRGRYALAQGGEPVGSIEGRTLRIDGFVTEAEAVEARHAGYVALLRWTASRPAAARARDPDAGGSVVARLARASVAGDEAARAAPFAVEYRLPAGLYAAVALQAAQTVHSAILTERERRASSGAAGRPDASPLVAGAAADA